MSWFSRNRVTLGFTAGLTLLAIVGAAAYSLEARFLRMTRWVKHSDQVLRQIHEISALVLDAEIGRQGFLLTHDARLLGSVDEARGRLNEEIEKALRLVADNPAQVERLQALQPKVRNFFSLVDETISMQRRRHSEREEIARLNTSLSLMQELRGVLNEIERWERHALTGRVAQLREADLRASLFTIVGGLLSFLLVLMAAVIVRRDNLALARERERAMKASQEKSDFLSSMTHELRTPLNAILGMSEVLGETPLNGEQAAYVRSLRRAGSLLFNLVNDVLDISKIEAGRMELEAVPFNLEEVVGGCLEVVSFKASEKGIRLEQRIDPAVPRQLVGDATRLSQALLNLLGNAEKFTHQGGVSLEIELEPSADDGAVRLRFLVADTGIGMTPEQSAVIFEKFRQAGPGIAREYGGSGLGLTITRHIVEAMGGAISVESRPGKGSTFCFSLPFGLPAAVQAGTAERRISDAPLRVLLVDDSQDNRLLIQSYLKATPYLLDLAVNGAEAVRKSEAARYDVILMDMHMPVMDGYAATRAIRERERAEGRHPTPIIGLTAYSLREEVRRLLEAGCSCYLGKPIRKERLLTTISELADPATAPAEAPEAVDRDIRELVPGYLANRQKELAALEQAVAANDFERLASIGHNLKGTGRSYGFAELSEAGRELENAARARDIACAAACVRKIETIIAEATRDFPVG